MYYFVLRRGTVLIFHCTVYIKHVLFCHEEGNRFPKTLDLYIKLYSYAMKVFVILWLINYFFYPISHASVANKENCAIYIDQKQKYWIGQIRQFALSSLVANSSGTVTPWADIKVMPSAKVTVHYG